MLTIPSTYRPNIHVHVDRYVIQQILRCHVFQLATSRLGRRYKTDSDSNSKKIHVHVYWPYDIHVIIINVTK